MHGSPVPVSSPDPFIQQIAIENPPVHFLKTGAKVAIKTKDKTYHFKMNLLMNDKESFYIETYGFGVPQGYASLLNNQLFVVIPSSHTMYVGTGSSSLDKLLGVKVSAKALFAVLLRQAFSQITPPYKIDVLKKEYIVTGSQEDIFHVSPSKWIHTVENPKSNSSIIRYGKPTALKYPQNVKVILENGSVEMTFENAKVNEPIDPKLFQIDVPSTGFDIYSID